MSDMLAVLGLVAAAAAVAFALLVPASRARSAAMTIALGLAGLLILGDGWNEAPIADIRASAGKSAVLAFAGLVAVALVAFAVRRRPELLPLGIVAALPFRIPLEGGGEDANLLLPLYLVIAGGVVATALRDSGPAGDLRTAVRESSVLRRALVAFAVVYALGVLPSEDFSKGLQNVCFFIVPFSIAFVLLADHRWDGRLLRLAATVVVAEAVLFALVGFVEYGTRSLLWNEEVIRSNDFHVYFRVNSLFWDPNVLGRYLALVVVVLTAVVLWTRDRRVAFASVAAIVLLLMGLAITFSQSSYAALLAGLAVLAALRWNGKATLAAVGAVLLIGGIGALATGALDRPNIDTGGRADLVSGGLELYLDRPIAGYGSGSFAEAFRENAADANTPVSESHSEPVSVAAEQGTIGLIAYFALLAIACLVLAKGMRRTMPGLGGTSPGAADGEAATEVIARAAILAAFAALLVHTLTYAGFIEDPITWCLLAIGGVLAARAP